MSLKLYDMLRRQVRTVVRAEQAGRHERRVEPSGLSSGVYFLRRPGEKPGLRSSQSFASGIVLLPGPMGVLHSACYHGRRAQK